MEIVRLKANDYDEWLYVLNTVFTKQNQNETDFEKGLPKMCVRDDEHMGRHLAIKDSGKICALLGIYPLKTKVGDRELVFSTVGNVATLPQHEGKGYMRILMQEAMEELKRIGADASRLSGARQRYQHYGYEPCGTEYKFIIDAFTTKYCFDKKSDISFREISSDDEVTLKFIRDIRQNEPICVRRNGEPNFRGEFTALCAWENKAYIAIDSNGNMIGYISATQDGKTIAEVVGKDFDSLKSILFHWQMRVDGGITFAIPSSKTEEVKYFYQNAAGMSVSPPCNFKIINFDRVADAFLRLKASIIPNLPSGEKVIQIKDWGNLLVYNRYGKAYCEKTELNPDIVLDRFTASRCLFGPFSIDTLGLNDNFLSSLLPLPLSWGKLDSV